MALSFDPEQLPHYAVDDHLPSVASHHLLADALRRRFLQPPVWEPETKAEPRFSERGPTAAAVLILQGALDLESSSGHPAGELVSTGRKPRHARRRKEHG